MEWWGSFILIIGSVFILAGAGLPIVFAFLVVDIVALCFFVGSGALWTLATSSYTSIANYNLAPLGLFMLMGEVLYHTGLVDLVMKVVDTWLGSLRSRYYVVALVTGTILAAMTGVSMAVVAMLGTIMVPVMVQRGYDKTLTLGIVLSSGTMAAIIPPSTLAVLYGILAQVSIGGMLIGGVLPGLLLSGMYIAYVLVRVKMDPSLAPQPEPSGLSFVAKLKASTTLLPFVIILFAVIGSITLGICTPTESAAAGTLACYFVAALFGRLKWSTVKRSFVTTTKIFGIIYFIFVGSTCFSQLLSITGITAGFAEFATHLKLSPVLLFFAFQAIVWVFGMLIDQISIMLITIPIFMPVVTAAGIDPLQFGVVFLVNSVVGGKTPPFGLMAFMLASVYKETTIEKVFRGVIPFLLLDGIALCILILFPKIILWLPQASGLVK